MDTVWRRMAATRFNRFSPEPTCLFVVKCVRVSVKNRLAETLVNGQENNKSHNEIHDFQEGTWFYGSTRNQYLLDASVGFATVLYSVIPWCCHYKYSNIYFPGCTLGTNLVWSLRWPLQPQGKKMWNLDNLYRVDLKKLNDTIWDRFLEASWAAFLKPVLKASSMAYFDVFQINNTWFELISSSVEVSWPEMSLTDKKDIKNMASRTGLGNHELEVSLQF